MYGEKMSTKERKVKDYWVRKFTSGLLEEDDLSQEAWLVYLKCKTTHDGTKSAFHTYYANVLRNWFINLYNKEKRHAQYVAVILDAPIEDSEEFTLADIQVSDRWTPEENITWNCLVETVRSRLSGLAKEIFDARIESNMMMLSYCRRDHLGDMTDTDMGKYLGVSRNRIKDSRFAIMRAVLLALDYGMEEIYETVRKKRIPIRRG